MFFAFGCRCTIRPDSTNGWWLVAHIREQCLHGTDSNIRTSASVICSVWPSLIFVSLESIQHFFVVVAQRIPSRLVRLLQVLWSIVSCGSLNSTNKLHLQQVVLVIYVWGMRCVKTSDSQWHFIWVRSFSKCRFIWFHSALQAATKEVESLMPQIKSQFQATNMNDGDFFFMVLLFSSLLFSSLLFLSLLFSILEWMKIVFPWPDSGCGGRGCSIWKPRRSLQSDDGCCSQQPVRRRYIKKKSVQLCSDCWFSARQISCSSARQLHCQFLFCGHGKQSRWLWHD